MIAEAHRRYGKYLTKAKTDECERDGRVQRVSSNPKILTMNGTAPCGACYLYIYANSAQLLAVMFLLRVSAFAI